MLYINYMKTLPFTLSLLLITKFVFADVTNWSQLSLKYFTTNAEHDIEIITGASPDADKIKTQGKFGINYQHQLTWKINPKLSFDVQDSFFFSEKSHERRNSFLSNDLMLGLLYRNDQTYLNFKLNNRYYNPDETNFLTSPGILHDTQQQMVSSAVLHLKQDYGKLNLNVYSNFRDLNYWYIVPIEEEEDEYDAYEARDFDSYTDTKLSYSMMDHLKIFGKIYYKNDLNESNLYDHTRIGGGIEYDNNIDLFSSLTIRTQYYNNISDKINNEQDHNLITQLRYSRRFLNGIAGFISYINRSCYDNETSQVYCVSNMLKVRAMYSYSVENLNNSYVLVGMKINPENNGTLGFIEQNQYIYKDIYSTASIKYSLDLFTSYSLKLEYFLNSLQSFWIKDEYTDFYDIQKQNLLFIGSTLIF